MPQLTTLPDEIVSIIFSSLDKISQVAECRLVCQQWNHLAKTAMLGHHITIKSEAGILRLYTLLIQHPEKAPLIKHLHFADGVHFNVLLRELIGIAVTHNIESLTGKLRNSAEFFNTMISMVERSPIKFDKLKTLTVSNDNGKPFQNLSLHFIDSVEVLEYDFADIVDWPYIKQLHGFKKLKTLTHRGCLDDLATLEKLLAGCPPGLQELTLSIFGWEDGHTWDKETTEKHLGLTKLKFDGYIITPGLLNYLLYKFVNLETIIIDVQFENDPIESDVLLMPAIISNSKVPHKDVTFRISPHADLRKTLATLKNSAYAIIVEDAEIHGDVKLKFAWN